MSSEKWKILYNGFGKPKSAEVLAVHAALLHTGEILYFGGDEHDPGRNVRGRTDKSVLRTFRLFNCKTNEITTTTSTDTDVFCCGHAFLADGRLLVAGGTETFDAKREHADNPHDHYTGLPNVFIFDPGSKRWIEDASMNPRPGQTRGGGRWYPTLVTLPDGNVFAMSGHPTEEEKEGGGEPRSEIHKNQIPEIYSPSLKPGERGSWQPLSRLGDVKQNDYPRLHVVFSNTDDRSYIFDSSQLRRIKEEDELMEIEKAWYLIDPSSPFNDSNPRTFLSFTETEIDIRHFGFEFTTVLLPLLPEEHYTHRILLCGGERPIIADIDAHSWRYTGERKKEMGVGDDGRPRLLPLPMRRHLNAVILPTGEIFICGGLSDPESPDTSGVLTGEIYDPKADQWRNTTVKASVTRGYHSVALLMPDGRVWTAGSNKNGGYSYRDAKKIEEPDEKARIARGEDMPGVDNRELRIEIFEPSYYGAERPQIVSHPDIIICDKEFEISTNRPSEITRISLIRTGSVTHAFNSDQRYIGLRFELKEGNRLRVFGPPSDITIPGFYLLFVIRDNTPTPSNFKDALPSEGVFVQVRLEIIRPFVYHKLTIEFESPAIPRTFMRPAEDIAIVNEKIIRTPQWSLRSILKSLADISTSEQFSSEDIRKTIRREALQTIIKVADEELNEMDFFNGGVAPSRDQGGHSQQSI